MCGCRQPELWACPAVLEIPRGSGGAGPAFGGLVSRRGHLFRSPTNSWAFIVGGVIGVNRQMPVRNHAPGTAVEKVPGIGLAGVVVVGVDFNLWSACLGCVKSEV